MPEDVLNFAMPKQKPCIIKVIGVGGGGGNAVKHMYNEGIHDVSFVVCNTDSQALSDSPVPNRLQLGAEGLGAGNRPERARKAAMEIAEDLTYYFAVSEQVPSSVALGVLVDTDCTVRQAGGFILQLMPDASEETISRLEQKLAGIPSITEMMERGMKPEDIIMDVLDGFSPEILERVPVGYRCNCTRDRVERALISIAAKDLKEMMKEGKDIEVGCQFCDRKYTFTPEDLRRMYVEKSVSRMKEIGIE